MAHTRRDFLSSSVVLGAAAATACASQDGALAAGMHVAMLGD